MNNESIIKSNISKRTKYDMMNDILYCCHLEWIGRTNIRRYCNLTTKNVYIVDILKDTKMLIERIHPNFKGGRLYQTSGKGLKFLKLYAELVNLMVV